jgi:hypothetical protein
LKFERLIQKVKELNEKAETMPKIDKVDLGNIEINQILENREI